MTAGRAHRIASAVPVIFAALLFSATAQGQTSSWSSRVEQGPAAASNPPPGVVMVPRPGARVPGASLSTRQAPIAGGTEPKGSILQQRKQAPPQPKTVAHLESRAAGTDPAYLAFDNAQFLTALKLAEQAAAKGEPEAHTLIGRIHAEGHGVPRDLALASRWYNRAAELGDPEGAFALGVMFSSGRGVTKDIPTASAFFEKAALKGHVWANYNLGLMFLSGFGKPENAVRGAQHIAYAAEKGVPAAQYDLATLYINGFGVPTDGYLAARWLRRAADLGLPEAQFDYAVMLLRGQGLNEDRPDAVRLLRAAAEQGLAGAQNRLAHALLEGAVIEKNPRESAKWRILARDQGLLDDPLDNQIKRMPAGERTAAEDLAAAWRERSTVGISTIQN